MARERRHLESCRIPYNTITPTRQPTNAFQRRDRGEVQVGIGYRDTNIYTCIREKYARGTSEKAKLVFLAGNVYVYRETI